MQITFYKTDLGIVVKDNNSIRLKSTYNKTLISEEDFNKSNPIKISRQTYLTELNKYFRNTKHSWIHNDVKFKKLDNFGDEKEEYILGKNLPVHNLDNYSFSHCFIVLYQGRLYYTFYSGNYYPQMQLINFTTKQLTGKWTNIKNLAPVFNCDTKQII